MPLYHRMDASAGVIILRCRYATVGSSSAISRWVEELSLSFEHSKEERTGEGSVVGVVATD